MNPALIWSTSAPTAPTRPGRPALRLTTQLVVLLLLGTAGAHYLFWQQTPGVNVLVYGLFIVAAHLARLPRYAPVRRRKSFWAVVAGGGLSLGAVAWYGSAAALVAALASGLVLLGLLNQPGLRQLGYAAGTALLGLGPAGRALAAGLWAAAPGEAWAGRLRRAGYYGRLLGLPLAALGVFQGLFALGSTRYAALSGAAWDALLAGLGRLLGAVSVPGLLFLALCGLGTAALLVVVPVHRLADHESRFEEWVRRRRDGVASLAVRRPDFRPTDRSPLALRREWLAAVATLVLLNLLLLAVNAVDGRWLWLGFRPAPDFDLTQFVHEGTYVLILSILLAAGIMLWFFRRHLNFYRPGLPLLRALATAWTLQNAFLALSVGLRNYYYILYTGLAYKRIGVYGFLLLTLFGLGTLLLKIWQRRSAFSLVRLNSWAAYALLLALAAGNWEIWIARYNLQPRFPRLDIGFLLNMPDRVLPELAARADLLAPGGPALVAENEFGHYQTLTPTEAQARLRTRLAQFRAAEATREWPSRTGADWRAYQALRGQ